VALYAYDEQQRSLLAVWGTGSGHRALQVLSAPETVKDEEIQHLVQAMSALSEAMWRTYTHPPEPAGSLEANTEGRRRTETRSVLPQVPDILLSPNLPQDGCIVTCYDPVEECAHQVGRALHAIGEASVSEAVVREMRIELDAIEQAGLGTSPAEQPTP
jgi:hypothetical protein